MDNLKQDTAGEKLKREKWYEISGFQPPLPHPSYKCKLFQKVKERETGLPKTYQFKFIRLFDNGNTGAWVNLSISAADAENLEMRPMNEDEIVDITETADSLGLLTEAEDAAGIKKKSNKSKKNLKKSKKSKKNLKKSKKNLKKSKKNLKKSKKSKKK